MTGTREPQQDGSIQAMLRDSGLEGIHRAPQLAGGAPRTGAGPGPRAPRRPRGAAGRRRPRIQRLHLFRRRFPRNDDDGDAHCRVRSGPHRRSAAGRRHEPRRAPRPEAQAGNRRRRRRGCHDPRGRRSGGLQRGLPRKCQPHGGHHLPAFRRDPRCGSGARQALTGGHSGGSRAVEARRAPPRRRRQMLSRRLPNPPQQFPRSPAPPHRLPWAAAESFRHHPSVRSRRGSPGSPDRAGTGSFLRIRCRSRPFPACFPRLPAQPSLRSAIRRYRAGSPFRYGEPARFPRVRQRRT